ERGVVTEHAGQEPNGGFDDAHRRQLTAREHEVAERNLFVHEEANALVEAFVAPAHEHHRFDLRATSGDGLRERHTLRGEQDSPLGARDAERLLGGLDAGHDAVGPHHHARAPAIRGVVHGEVLAEAVTPERLEVHRERAVADGASDEAGLQESLEQLGEERDDRDAHEPSMLPEAYSMRPSRLESSMRRPSTSMRATYSGKSTSSTRLPFACSITTESTLGFTHTSTTRPTTPSGATTSAPTRSTRYTVSGSSAGNALRCTSTRAPRSAAAASRSSTPANET